MTRWPVRALSLLAALSLGLLTVLVAPRPAYACSCSTIGRQSFADQADAIFTGQVRSTTTVHQPSPGRTDIHFAVSRVFKGTVYADQVVATPRGTDGCGLHFVVGSTWVVFAEERVEGSGGNQVFRLVSQQCNGNILGSAAPAELGPGQAPLAGASDREERAETNDHRLTRTLEVAGSALLGLVVLGGVAVAVLWRHGRQ